MDETQKQSLHLQKYELLHFLLKQIAEQQLLRAQTEVKIAEQEAQRYETLNRTLDDQVLFKLFLDKWDGSTKVVPALPGSKGGGTPVIVGGR